jgi:hypothetical protein
MSAWRRNDVRKLLIGSAGPGRALLPASSTPVSRATRRAIDFHEGEEIDEHALKDSFAPRSP